MSDAYKCDGCGELISGEPPNTLKVRNSKDGVPVIGGPHISEGSYEICGECGEELDKFLS